jgi:hypothetical protein
LELEAKQADPANIKRDKETRSDFTGGGNAKYA